MNDFSIVVVAVWFFLAGCAMGSFYNVLIDRLPNDQKVVKDRSKCTYCGTVLKWKDLIPVVSFLALRGKCRYCGKKLSPQYLISELSVGALFLLGFFIFYNTFSVPGLVLNLTLWSMLFVTAVMDFKYGIIMDQILLAFSLIGVVTQLIAGREAVTFELGGQVFEMEGRDPWQMLYGALAGLLFYGLIYLVARLLYRKEGFGFGDVLLLGAVGIFLGLEKTIITGFLAFYCSILYLLFFKLVRKGSLKDRPIPFAPPLCTAAFIMSLFGNEIATWLRTYLGY